MFINLKNKNNKKESLIVEAEQTTQALIADYDSIEKNKFSNFHASNTCTTMHHIAVKKNLKLNKKIENLNENNDGNNDDKKNNSNNNTTNIFHYNNFNYDEKNESEFENLKLTTRNLKLFTAF
jgi:hypothetical protein